MAKKKGRFLNRFVSNLIETLIRVLLAFIQPFFLPVLSSQFSPRSVTCCEMYSSFVWLLIRSHVVNYETNCKWVCLFCFEKPATTWPERYNKYWIYTITTWHDDMLSKPDSICALTLSLNSLEKSQLNKTVGLELTVPNSKLFCCCCCCS